MPGQGKASYNVVSSRCNAAHDMPQRLPACRYGRPAGQLGRRLPGTRPVRSVPLHETLTLQYGIRRMSAAARPARPRARPQLQRPAPDTTNVTAPDPSKRRAAALGKAGAACSLAPLSFDQLRPSWP